MNWLEHLVRLHTFPFIIANNERIDYNYLVKLNQLFFGLIRVNHTQSVIFGFAHSN